MLYSKRRKNLGGGRKCSNRKSFSPDRFQMRGGVMGKTHYNVIKIDTDFYKYCNKERINIVNKNWQITPDYYYMKKYKIKEFGGIHILVRIKSILNTITNEHIENYNIDNLGIVTLSPDTNLPVTLTLTNMNPGEPLEIKLKNIQELPKDDDSSTLTQEDDSSTLTFI